MSSGERDPWYAYPDRTKRTYTQEEVDVLLAAERERWESVVKRLLPLAEDSLMRPELDVVCLDARSMLTQQMMSADGCKDIPL